MDVARTMTRLGGCATWADLRRHHPRRVLTAALASGELVRLARGRYATAAVSEHRRVAHALTATLSHLSAAQHYGWSVKDVPELPWLTVRRARHLQSEQRRLACVFWADLTESDVTQSPTGSRATSPATHSPRVTSPLRTVIDCARALPFDEALCLADAALRTGWVQREFLEAAAHRAAGPGAAKVRRVADLADGRAANPLESCLRAIALDVPELQLVPQMAIAASGVYATVDLGDRARLLAVEAEGYEHHGSRKGLRRDCRRYTELALLGWTVLRFGWEDVMLDPAYVRAVLARAATASRAA